MKRPLMRDDHGIALLEGGSSRECSGQNRAGRNRPSKDACTEFEHPADITLRKIGRLSRVLPVAAPKVRLSNQLPVFATGALRGTQLSRGILVLCAQMRGIRQMTADTQAVPGLSIEARLQGRSFSREAMPPYRTARIESGTISINGFPTESRWTVEMPAQKSFDAVSVCYPPSFLDALSDTDPELAARAKRLVADQVCQREAMSFSRRLPFVKLQQLCLRDRSGSKLRAEAIALDLLVDTVEALSERQTEKKPSETLVEKVCETIEARLSSPPKLAQLAQLFRVSETQLKRSFSEQTGQPIGRYIAQRRMEAAWALVTMGLPLAQVADEVGYANPEAFSRAFRRHYGQCPSAARAARQHDAR